MAIRQYIGARYVPRFTGVFDPTQIYDALDVVDNGSGTSYIARKTVPPGTSLTDTTYWFVYGASSGAILALQNRMDAAEQDILDLNADIDLLKYGDIVIITDSYGHWPSAADNYVEILKTMIPNTVYYDSTGGAGFGSTIPFAGRLQALEPSIPDNDKVGLIIVAGGYNDTSHISDIPAGMVSFATYANTEFPNAEIVVFYLGLTTEASRNLTNQTNVLPSYHMNAPDNPKMSFAEGSEKILRNYSHLDSGGVHPNHDGAVDIARGIKNWMVSKTVSGISGLIDQKFDSSGLNTTSFTDKVLRCSLCGDMVTAWATSSVNASFAADKGPTVYTEIAEFQSVGLINGNADYWCRAVVPCNAHVNDGGGNYSWLTGATWIAFNNGKIYVMPASFRNNYDQISIPAFTVNIPIRWC